MSNGLKVAHDGGFRLGLLTGLCALALVPSLEIPSASAQGAAPPGAVTPAPTARVTANASQPNAAAKAAKRNFIEFRARSALTYGHTFSIYGRLDAKGKIVSSVVTGLHPATESSVPWMIGHFVPVPSETGASDGDTEDQYVISRFRMVLDDVEYRKLTTFIKKLQDSSPVWHAALYNCNAFVGDIARFMGLETPAITLMGSQEYVDRLRELNIDRRDLAGVLGTPVKVEDASELRSAALRASSQREKPQRPAKPAGATR